ncbi:hypothetical protein BD309DRAFT_946024 [Dichomitus squalens]|nr:hypothetical protein BD309DRAFT_946024 [Dichomitus squalens]
MCETSPPQDATRPHASLAHERGSLRTSMESRYNVVAQRRTDASNGSSAEAYLEAEGFLPWSAVAHMSSARGWAHLDHIPDGSAYEIKKPVVLDVVV